MGLYGSRLGILDFDLELTMARAMNGHDLVTTHRRILGGSHISTFGNGNLGTSFNLRTYTPLRSFRSFYSFISCPYGYNTYTLTNTLFFLFFWWHSNKLVQCLYISDRGYLFGMTFDDGEGVLLSHCIFFSFFLWQSFLELGAELVNFSPLSLTERPFISFCFSSSSYFTWAILYEG